MKTGNSSDSIPSFGVEEAEYDLALHDAFVPTSVMGVILQGHRSIVRGPKGSGKSAFYRMLVEKGVYFPTEIKGFFSEEFDRSIYLGLPISDIKEWFAKDIQHIKMADEHSIASLWVSLFGIYLVDQLRRNLEFWPAGLAPRVQDACLASGLSRTTAAKLVSGGRTFIAHILSGITFSLKSDGSFEFGINPDATRSQAKQESFSETLLVTEVDKLLREKKLYVSLCVDNIDDLLPYSPDLQEKLLRGLFLALRDIQKFRSLRTLVFVRTDIYRSLELTQSDKLEARSIDIIWHISEVMHHISRRLRGSEHVMRFCADNRINPYDQGCLFRGVFPLDPESEPESWVRENLATTAGAIYPRYVVYILNQAAISNTWEDARSTYFSSESLHFALRSLSSTLRDMLLNDYKIQRQVLDVIEGDAVDRFTFDDICKYFPGEAPFVSFQLAVLEKVGYIRKTRPRLQEPGGRSVYEVAKLYRHHWEDPEPTSTSTGS